jgi:hypothetical protein
MLVTFQVISETGHVHLIRYPQVDMLIHSIVLLIQPVFALTPYRCCMLNEEAANINVDIFLLIHFEM